MRFRSGAPGISKSFPWPGEGDETVEVYGFSAPARPLAPVARMRATRQRPRSPPGSMPSGSG